MAKKRIRIPRNHSQERGHFIAEKYLVKKYFPFFRCTLYHDRLLCQGSVVPSEGCDAYKVKVSYVRGGIPEIFITDPYIKPDTEYHIYKEGNLCLYDWRDMPWQSKMKIHETIIPWTAEWLVFYEIWKLTGEWHGAIAPHDKEQKLPETIFR